MAGVFRLLSLPVLIAILVLPPASLFGLDGGSSRDGGETNPESQNPLQTWQLPPSRPCDDVPTTEPLLPKADTWTLPITFPALLFMGEPTGDPIAHTYTLYPNGTFLVEDHRGNSFAWAGLGGLPAGTVQTSFLANSTTASQSYSVVANDQVLASVTISYAVRYQFCFPAGLKVRIQGQANWGATGRGALFLPFNKAPIEFEGSRAWFGNNSDVWLGFDWSDALASSPSFNNATGALVFIVGDTFEIDPSTVATVSTGEPFMHFAGRCCFATPGRYFVNFLDIVNNVKVIKYVSSIDGITWTAPVTLISGVGGIPSNWNFFYDGTYAYYAWHYQVAPGINSSAQLKFMRATVSGSTITPGTIYTPGPTTNGRGAPSVVTAASGRVYATSAERTGSTGSIGRCRAYWNNNGDGSGTWTAVTVRSSSDLGAPSCAITRFPSGASNRMVYVAFDDHSPGQELLGGRTLDGSTLGSVETIASYTNELGHVAYDDAGGIYVTYNDGTNIFLQRRVSGVWQAVEQVGTPGTNSRGAITVFTGNGDLRVYWAEAANNRVMYRDRNAGVWSAAAVLASGEVSPSVWVINSYLTIYQHSYAVGWRSGTTAPFNVRFASQGHVFWEYATDKVVTVANNAEFQTEGHIAASRVNQQLLVAGVIDYDPVLKYGCRIYRSEDNGATWTDLGRLPLQPGDVNASDPVVASDSNGIFYVMCITLTASSEFSVGYWRSTDSSATAWTGWNNVEGPRADRLNDKPWLATFGTSVYMCDTLVRTDVNGNPFASDIVFRQIVPVATYRTLATAGVAADNGVQGCYIATGPNGEIYVAWIHYEVPDNNSAGSIKISRSYDGGNNWTPPTTVTTLQRLSPCPVSVHGCLMGERNQQFRVDSFPRMAVGANGVVHIAYAQSQPVYGGEVYYLNSDTCQNGGACNWSTPHRVNLDLGSQDQWEPAIAVSRANGMVHVTALDRRTDPDNILWRAWDYSCHWNENKCRAAADWIDTQVSCCHSGSDQKDKIGDYHGVTGDSARGAVTIWTDSHVLLPSGLRNFDIDEDRSTS